MRNLGVVTSFTINEMVKRKSFIISTIVILLMIVIAFNIPNIMQKFDANGNENLLILDPENLFEGQIENLNELNLGYQFNVLNEDLSEDEIKQKVENDFDACIKFTKGENANVKMEYIVESAAMNYGEIPQTLVATFTNLYSNVQITKLNLTPEQLQAIEPQLETSLVETDENAAKGNVFIMMMISIVLFYAVRVKFQQQLQQKKHLK